MSDAKNKVTTLRSTALARLLAVSIRERLPVLLTGAPGTGKSDIVAQAVHAVGADMILSHPAVADPTDAKGLPWKSTDSDSATFLPFGDLARALAATKPTVWFLDDLGQASPAVQASFMQLLLARRVNDHVLPDHITFIAATNRRTDRAGVSGILEPVKSRFATIVELEPHIDDWRDWAVRNGVAHEVIAFLRFMPQHLINFKPTADMTNSPCPRTWFRVSQWLKADLPRDLEFAAYAGAVGEGAALEFLSFLKLARDLPDLDEIIKNPKTSPLPKEMSALHAVSAGLAMKADASNFDSIAVYLERITDAGNPEFSVYALRDAQIRDPQIQHTKGFVRLAAGYTGAVFTGEAAGAA